MYRPQFPYASDPTCLDQRAHYSFDSSRVPALGNIPAGGNVQKIPLVFDQDADFFLRGIQIQATALRVQLEGPYLDLFSDNYRLDGAGFLEVGVWASTDGYGIVTLDSDEWGIFCPKGSKLLAYILNPTAGALSAIINVHGIKRYREGRCA